MFDRNFVTLTINFLKIVNILVIADVSIPFTNVMCWWRNPRCLNHIAVYTATVRCLERDRPVCTFWGLREKCHYMSLNSGQPDIVAVSRPDGAHAADLFTRAQERCAVTGWDRQVLCLISAAADHTPHSLCCGTTSAWCFWQRKGWSWSHLDEIR